MLSIEEILDSRNHINETADLLSPEDIAYLIELLNIKNNDIRYAALLLLESRSLRYADVYDYWDVFVKKLSDENSYQRSIGVMMIASNVKWDKINKFDRIAEKYLQLCEDEKFITARQTIQSIEKWLEIKPSIHPFVVRALLNIDISKQKDTQKKLLFMDILRVLAKIHDDKILETATAGYVKHALSSGILDKKSAKEVETLFGIRQIDIQK